MQVYAIVYCPETNEVLVCRKKKIGCFFQNDLPKNRYGKYSDCARSLNGGGRCCFPGGKLNDRENSRNGAVREFKEETGVDLSQYGGIEDKIKTPRYQGVLFEVSQDNFSVIYGKVFKNLYNKKRWLQYIAVQCRCNQSGIVPYIFSKLKACGFNCKSAKTKDHTVDRWYSCLASSLIKDDELASVERRKGPCKIICVNRKYKCVQGDSRCTKEAQKKKMY